MIINDADKTIKYFDNGYKTVKLTDEQFAKLPRNITDTTFKILLDSDFRLDKPVKLKMVESKMTYFGDAKLKTYNNIKRLDALLYGANQNEQKLINRYKNEFVNCVKVLSGNQFVLNVFNSINSIDYPQSFDKKPSKIEKIKDSPVQYLDKSNFDTFVEKFIISEGAAPLHDDKKFVPLMRAKYKDMRLVRKLSKDGVNLGRKIYVYGEFLKTKFNQVDEFMQLSKFIICYCNWEVLMKVILNTYAPYLIREYKMTYITNDMFCYGCEGVTANIEYANKDLDMDVLQELTPLNAITRYINDKDYTQDIDLDYLTHRDKIKISKAQLNPILRGPDWEDALYDMYIGKAALAYPNPNEILLLIWDVDGIIQQIKGEFDALKTNTSQKKNFTEFFDTYNPKMQKYFKSDMYKLLNTLTMYGDWNPNNEPFNFQLSKTRLDDILAGGKKELKLYNELAENQPHIKKYGDREAKGNKILKDIPNDVKNLYKKKENEPIGIYANRLLNLLKEEERKAKEEEEARKAKETKKEDKTKTPPKEGETTGEEPKEPPKKEETKESPKEEETKESPKEEDKFETFTDSKTGEPLPASIDTVPDGLFPPNAGLDMSAEILNELKQIHALLLGGNQSSKPSAVQPQLTQTQEATGQYPMMQENLQEALTKLRHVIPNVKEVIPSDEDIDNVKYQIENFDRNKLKKYRAGISTNYLEYYNYLSDTNNKIINDFVRLNPDLVHLLMTFDSNPDLSDGNGGLKDKILNSIPGVSTLYQIFKTVYPIIRPVVQKAHEKYIDAFNKKAQTDSDLVPIEKGMITRTQLDKTLNEDIHMKPLSVFNGILNGK